MAPGNFLVFVAGLTLALAAGVATLNQLVDPYELRTAATLQSAQRSEGMVAGEFLRRSRAVRVAAPRTVILGTSRAGTGLNPLHASFTADDAPVINLSMGAASIHQLRMLLVHAHTSSPLRKAVIGLDLESFVDRGRPDFDDSALAGNPDSEHPWLVRARTLLSVEMLVASIARVANSGSTASMQNVASRPDRHEHFEQRLAELGGQRHLVWLTEFSNFYSRLPQLFPGWPQDTAWNSNAHRAAAMREFVALLRYARKENIELHMFISPVHARYLEWYRNVGWWPLFEHWKRALAETIATEAATAPARAPFPVWDFSGFYSLTSEAVPQPDDLNSRMRWYFESSHYSSEMGDLILRRMLDRRGTESWLLPDSRIDLTTIEKHIASMSIDAAVYRATHPGEAANVAQMVLYLRRVARR